MTTSIRWLPLFWIACLAPLQASAQARAANSWLPLAVGNKWTYSMHEDTTFYRGDSPQDRRFAKGRSVDLVVRKTARKFEGAPIFVLEENSLRETFDPSPRTHSLNTRHFSDAHRGVQLHETRKVEDGDAIQFRYAPPVRLFRSGLVAGNTWKVGLLRDRGFSIDLVGEVMGREDVTIDETKYANCLKLRLQGPIVGVAGNDRGVTGGYFRRDIWLKEGVGLVQDFSQTSVDVELANEIDRIRQTKIRRLRSHQIVN